MKKYYFLLDENILPGLADQLRRLDPEINVLKVGDDAAPSYGTKDPDILLWLEKNNYCLVTRNRKSMPRHLNDHIKNGHYIPGLFIIRPQSSNAEIIEDLLLIWELADPDEHQNQIVYIPL